MSLQRIYQLRHNIEHLQKAKQTVRREVDLTHTKLELAILEGEREAAVARMTLQLIDSYRRTGIMRVVLPDRLDYASPIRTNNEARLHTVMGNPETNVSSEVQRWWNVRSEAERLARMAVR